MSLSPPTLSNVSLDNEDPEAFTEMFSVFQRSFPQNRRFRNGDLAAPPSSASDPKLSARFSRVLDIISRCAVTRHGQVATAAASVKEVEGTLNTTIYISYTECAHPDVNVAGHIESLFSSLRSTFIPNTVAIIDDPKLDQPALRLAFQTLTNSLYTFGWDLWQYYVGKYMEHLEQAMEVVTSEKGASLTKHQCKELLTLLRQIERLKTPSRPEVVAALCHTWMLMGYTKPESKDKCGTGRPRFPLSLLDKLENLMDIRGVHFPLQRWITKLSSFHIEANNLFHLAHSKRLDPILQGSFRVVVVPSPSRRPPIHVDLKRKTIDRMVSTAKLELKNRQAYTRRRLGNSNQDEVMKSFIDSALESDQEITHARPCVHSELEMLRYLHENDIDSISYLGISKFPCAGCDIYLGAFGRVTGRFISTRGTSGKFYPAWLMPSLKLQGQDASSMVTLLKDELATFLVSHIVQKYDENSGDRESPLEHASQTMFYSTQRSRKKKSSEKISPGTQLT